MISSNIIDMHMIDVTMRIRIIVTQGVRLLDVCEKLAEHRPLLQSLHTTWSLRGGRGTQLKYDKQEFHGR
jgi:hypothetical protein